jgi:hypothetical protein
MKWYRASIPALIVGVLSWSACGDDATGPTVATVEVTPATATIAPGATVQLSATVRDESGDPLSGFTVTWSSEDEAIATVDEDGLVTGEADGIADISASAGGESGTAEITVVTPVASVEVTPAADTVRAGLTTQLTATPKDAQGNALTGRTITWSSDDETVATVDMGVVTGESSGTATITATSEGQSGAADVTVWVGVTGSWSGTMTIMGGTTTCDLSLSLTEDLSRNITGSGQFSGAGCATLSPTVTGTNNTGGVADSVVMIIEYIAGLCVGTFNGNFDGIDQLDGIQNGCGGELTNETTSLTRQSIQPAPPAQRTVRAQSPDRPQEYPLLRKRPRDQ